MVYFVKEHLGCHAAHALESGLTFAVSEVHLHLFSQLFHSESDLTATILMGTGSAF